jgi:hypothetical protein
MKARFPAVLALAFFFSGLLLRADSVILPGSAITVVIATTKANAILAGRIIDLQPVDASAPDGRLLAKVKFTSPQTNGISSVPVNSPNDGLLHGPLSVMDDGIPILVIAGPGESSPVVGSSYIFWVLGDAQRGVQVYNAFKLLPGTAENIIGERHLIQSLAHARLKK